MRDEGTAYFYDGHEERIIFWHKFDDSLIEFYTKSGKYCYVAYMDNLLFGYQTKRYRIYLSHMSVNELGDIEQRWYTSDIDRIELKYEL